MTTHASGRARITGLAVLGSVLALSAMAGFPFQEPVAQASPLQQGSTTVAVTPADVDLACGESKEVDVRLNDVEDLFGVDIKVSYNPSIVEVVDANTTTPGTQVEQGDLPDVSGGQGLIQVNSVDTASGTVSYAAVRLNPAPAQSGSGVIATITFKGKGAGSTPVTLVSAILADETARAISAELINGEITVTGSCQGGPPATVTPGGPPPLTPPPPGGHNPPGGHHPPGGQPPHVGDRHIVKPGDTLYSIARLYGTSVSAIMAANKIYNPDLIYVGQVLLIPSGHMPPHDGPGGPGHDGPGGPGGPGRPPYDPGKPGYGDCQIHIVKPGESLFGIALMYGESVNSLAHRNGIINPDLIFVGQAIEVCGDGWGWDPGWDKPGWDKPGWDKPGYDPGWDKPGYDPGWGKPGHCSVTHVVKPGENLFRIALMYGVHQGALAAANNIANPHLIYAGQVLCIP